MSGDSEEEQFPCAISLKREFAKDWEVKYSKKHTKNTVSIFHFSIIQNENNAKNAHYANHANPFGSVFCNDMPTMQLACPPAMGVDGQAQWRAVLLPAEA
eukprot:EG_transcript_41236